MSVTHDEAVCLRHREWSETSQTVILLTRRHGLINGLAKGSRRERANFSGGFELLQFGELGFVLRPDKELVTLTDWDLTNPYVSLRGLYTAAVFAMFAAELTVSLLAPGDPHPRVLDGFLGMLDESVEASESVTTSDCRPLATYLSALLVDTGQFPDLATTIEPDTHVQLYDPAHACLVRPSPDTVHARDPFTPGADQNGHWPIRSETIELLRGRHDGADPRIGPAPGPRAWTRAARFLAAWVVYRSGRRPASLDAFLRVTRF
ncbi:MAG: recombination protein O N-terminal domain-containing protein [Phycisphaerales bacterium]|nr:recombination protein O N-terminal domain-containing protein [Phycisphaerales bacterium]